MCVCVCVCVCIYICIYIFWLNKKFIKMSGPLPIQEKHTERKCTFKSIDLSHLARLRRGLAFTLKPIPENCL